MVARASKKDVSPSNRKSTKEATSTRTFRKSPARTGKPKSPTTATKKTPPASPSRRSPVRRSPSRKSPSRKSPARKSPARKSPARAAKPSASTDRNKPKSSANKAEKEMIDVDSDSDVDIYHKSNLEKPKAAVRGRARKLDIDYTSPKVILQNIDAVNQPTVDKEIRNYVGLVRRSIQKTHHEVDRIVHLKSSDASVKKLTEFSDEDEVPAVRSSFVKEKSERYSESKVIDERTAKTEFGGWIGALIMMFLIPVGCISLCIVCNESQCSFTKMPNLKPYKQFSTFIDFTALALYSSFLLLVAILSALPIGGYKVSGLPNKQGKLTYVMNGLFILVIVSLTLVGCEFYKVSVISIVLKKYFQLIVSSFIIAFVLAIYLYVRSYFIPVSALNPCAIVSNSRIYNFWAGRELSPRIFGVIDVKVLLYRCCVIGMILLNALFLYQSFERIPVGETRGQFDFRVLKINPTLLVIATLQISYALDYLIFESAIVSTFDVQHEGVGFMSTASLIPSSFMVGNITKYIYDYKIQLPVWHLAISVILFVIGYVLTRGSNSQKHAFRQNPYNPALSHLESIPTSQGKKLLVSGYWGMVRHPNYLGESLVMLSFASFALTAPPIIFCILDIAYLIHRAHRDHVRCKQRYGAAWDRYCQRVKYVLIPKIY